jgi:hypothetical protein
MHVIRVSFFTDMSCDTRTRNVPLPHTAQQDLHGTIRQMMQGPEFFACYNHPSGGVVALDRQGVCIQI